MATTNTGGAVDALSAHAVLTGEPSGRPAEPQVGRIDCRTCNGTGHGQELGRDCACTDCHGDGAQRCESCHRHEGSIASLLLGGDAVCLDCAARIRPCPVCGEEPYAETLAELERDVLSGAGKWEVA